jgi:hypothetical protein
MPTFSDDKLMREHYLGLATDVGLALTAQILKSNGQTVCRLTLQHWTNKEIHCPIYQETPRVFMESVSEALGPAVGSCRSRMVDYY